MRYTELGKERMIIGQSILTSQMQIYLLFLLIIKPAKTQDMRYL